MLERRFKMRLPGLNRQFYASSDHFPVRALQIGEGNFIRAFVDWMIHRCNRQELFQGSVVVTQPRKTGAAKLQKIKVQDGLFTIFLKGIENGEVVEKSEIVSSISMAIDPYSEWESFLSLAEDPNLEFVFSNTTEAGIAYISEEADFRKPIHSFPGKLTAFLYRRYRTVKKGLIILPCELLERAGSELKTIILKHAEDWNLGTGFEHWIKEENTFLNSLVDRIVTGYPNKEAEQLEQSLGYTDCMLTISEPYHQWVIEGDEEISKKLPFHKAGLNVIWVKDLNPYVKRKVRILNSAHTFMVPIAFMQGHDIVRNSVEDPFVIKKVTTFLKENVLPVLSFNEDELRQYVKMTIERFQNPYIDHQLLDISLNSISKFSTRILPTLSEYIGYTDQVPGSILQSLAYLIRFYRCEKTGNSWRGWRIVDNEKDFYTLRDSEQILNAFASNWLQYGQSGDLLSLVTNVLSSGKIWSVPFNKHEFGNKLDLICDGVAEELRTILKET
jgi:tagaturonate reductase